MTDESGRLLELADLSQQATLKSLIQEVTRIPKVVLIAFVSSLALLAFDAVLLVTIAFSASSKIDQGIATLCGAVIGLSVVAWQARIGFQNLVKSQENQARIERDARLHQAELQQSGEERTERKRKAALLGALRAEIAYLFGAVSDAENHIHGLILIERALMARGLPSSTKTITLHSFTAPVFQANIPNLGLLGAYLGADIIKVLSRANGKELKIELQEPMPHDVVLVIYDGNHSSLQKWASDLFHVAMRIRAEEDGTPDPGTLGDTQEKRYAQPKKGQ